VTYIALLDFLAGVLFHVFVEELLGGELADGCCHCCCGLCVVVVVVVVDEVVVVDGTRGWRPSRRARGGYRVCGGLVVTTIAMSPTIGMRPLVRKHARFQSLEVERLTTKQLRIVVEDELEGGGIEATKVRVCSCTFLAWCSCQP